MSPNQNHDHNDPFTLTGLRQSIRQNIEVANDIRTGLSATVRTVFALLLIAISTPAAMATPLLRHRMGFQTLLVHGVLGILLLWALAPLFARGSTGGPVALWLLVLQVSFVLQLARGLVRMFHPVPGDHIHRHSLGEPRPTMHRLWRRCLGDRAMSGARVAILGEAPLMLGVAFLLLGFERLFGSSEMGNLSLLPALCGVSIAGQAGLQCLKQAYRRQVILDRELEQRELAESIAEHGMATDHRKPEGFSQLPR